jgi:hypothetical protein
MMLLDVGQAKSQIVSSRKHDPRLPQHAGNQCFGKQSASNQHIQLYNINKQTLKFEWPLPADCWNENPKGKDRNDPGPPIFGPARPCTGTWMNSGTFPAGPLADLDNWCKVTVVSLT